MEELMKAWRDAYDCMNTANGYPMAVTEALAKGAMETYFDLLELHLQHCGICATEAKQ